ncbi:hypothetical protein F5146DRAFT_1075768 [Armillaria mellea]|nr:hypothetical protein F5146DRAFT_1080325 [Armillaria mellea]KAK0184179.1 hypothetical protein F5146DRAFT_1075567 [Armillaria mellea]KAK0184249.1 hypothetical protein F5146DRAFT_1075768 [Armillaria mellea]
MCVSFLCFPFRTYYEQVMKTIETFTPPTSDAESIGGITYDTSGPFHSSYPAVYVPPLQTCFTFTYPI